MADILIVDDNEDITRFLLKALNQRFPDLEVIGFTESLEALEWLQDNMPGLIITDLRMPFCGGAEIITAAVSKNRDVPIIVISALAVLEEFKDTERPRETVRYLPKPFLFDDLINLLAEMRDIEPESVIQGFLPINMLQIIQLENKSCRIVFEEDERIGTLVFERGELRRAETSDLESEEALYEILGFKGPTIKLFDVPTTFETNIHKKLQVLLLEYCSHVDERDEKLTA